MTTFGKGLVIVGILLGFFVGLHIGRDIVSWRTYLDMFGIAFIVVTIIAGRWDKGRKVNL